MDQASENASRWNLKRFGQSFRHGAHSVRKTLREEAVEQMRRARRVPRWVRLTHKLYHEYGLKHVCLILILIAYQFFGAAVFYICESRNEENQEQKWHLSLEENRTELIRKIVGSMFNNTDYLFFLTNNQSNQVEIKLESELKAYEQKLGVRFRDRQTKWDFWASVLYAQMICTTIGGGFVRLYPSTNEGRLFTMIYALFGVPLVLTVLDDLGKLLTKLLKIPWFWTKCACRRMFRYCTRQTMAEIKALDADDKRDTELFELPIPIAICIVILWISICSFTFCIFETEWSYFISFYFFFISLSTIGIGDFSPREPKYLLVLFVYIIIGLSLVSMLVNAIQSRLERTYQTGQNQLYASSTADSDLFKQARAEDFESVRRCRSSLGVLKGVQSSAAYSITREAVQRHFAQKNSHNKSSQTLLSFPSPTRNSMVTRSVYQNRLKIFPRTLSIDDVMKLVDTEEGDILLLTELTREESGLSELNETFQSDLSRDSSVNQLVVSKSFDSNFNSTQLMQQQIESTYLPSFFSSSKALPRQQQAHRISTNPPSNCPSTVPVPLDLEEIEEFEDLLVLSRSGAYNSNPGVYFRSRLSLVNEEECGESSISTTATDQTASSSIREDSQSRQIEMLDKNRNHVRRNRIDRTTRNNNRQNNSTKSSILSGPSTSGNNNYYQRSGHSKNLH